MSNIQPYIILNDIDSRTISGLLISSLPPISKPQVRTQVETVDGRDGDLVTPLGFSAYDKVITIGLTYGYDIDDVIEYFNSEGVVVFSNEPDKFYRYAIYEQIDFDKLIRFKKAEVTLHCQPFKFSTTEAPIVRNGSGSISINVNNSGNIYSRPELLLTGSGNATVDLNSSEILSVDLDSANGAIFIDSENMNAYGAKSAINNVIAYINAYQDGEGDPSPSNERTIHGFTELNIVDTPDSNLTELNTIDNNFKGVVNFNQLARDMTEIASSYSLDKWYVTSGAATVSSGVVTLTPTAQYGRINCFIPYTANHKLLVMGDLKLSNSSDADKVTLSVYSVDTSASGMSRCSATTEWQHLQAIYTHTSASPAANRVIITDTRTSDWGTIQAKNIVCIDLTAMFGTTIADYIYSLEQAHAGDGVAFFRNLYPNDYYDYNTGTRELMPLTEKTVYTVDISENPQDPDNPHVVYGGYYESKTGLLNITWLTDIYNSNSGFSLHAISKRWYKNGVPAGLDIDRRGLSISNSLICADRSGSYGAYFYYGSSGIYINKLNSNETIEDLNTRLSSTPLFIVYPLAKPIQIQLAPTQINNLIGLNQVFTDTNGDVAVDYRASGEAHFEQAPIVSFTCTFEDIIKGTLLNRAVTGNYDNIKLNIGLNNLVVNGSGVNQFAIDKYSRWL